MKTTTLIQSSITLLAMTIAGAPMASANPTFTMTSANSCKAASPAAAGDVIRHEKGLGNRSTSGLGMYCPISVTASCWDPYIQELDVFYNDRSATSLFGCYVYGALYGGNWTWWNEYRWTCSDGGCTDPTTAYVGTGRIRWTDLTFDLDPVNLGVYCVVAGGDGTEAGSSWLIGSRMYSSCP